MTEIKIKVIGRGTVTQQPLRGGLTIQLQAIPDTGAVFIGWGKFGHLPFSESSVCNVNPNFSGTVVAVFKDKNTNDVNFGETMPTFDTWEYFSSLGMLKITFSTAPSYLVEDDFFDCLEKHYDLAVTEWTKWPFCDKGH